MARAPITAEAFSTPAGRRRAWRELMLRDHGLLRKFYRNTHEISPGELWRAYQPSPRDLERWRDKGVKTIVNLRGDKPSGFYFLEKDACERLGLELVTFRVFSRDAPSKEAFHGAKTLYEQIAYPAVIHCKSGADRAGLMACLFLFLHKGRHLDESLEQLTFRYGHVKAGKTGVIDFAFEQFRGWATENGKSLSSVDDFFEWVDGPYDPATTKAAFRGKGWGDLLTETILRRE
ncbi:MAG: protein tyrosine phosphatase [Pseudomonadota bacterium]